MVVTGDRDLFQLIEPGVRVMATSRGITETKVYDRDAVIDRYGIAPELIPDFVGLKGDTSDNIPGVPGIGEKTASQLLQEHGSLEGVLGNIDKISGAKRKENLSNHAEDARVSKTLATAIRDIDLGEIDLDHIAAREPDRSRCARRSGSSSCARRSSGSRRRSARARRPRRRSVPRKSSIRRPSRAAGEIGALEGELVALAASARVLRASRTARRRSTWAARRSGRWRSRLTRRRGARGRVRDPHRPDHGARMSAPSSTTTGRPRR
jgi:DNA polymerase-1